MSLILQNGDFRQPLRQIRTLLFPPAQQGTVAIAGNLAYAAVWIRRSDLAQLG
jgi:hypothetical protein